jgi:predicted AlkP superfamily phosphohydrolase/phosphomutase
VDGAEWKVIRWMWDQGRLPTLKRLVEQSVWGPLETFHYASPVIWTTVATGVLPEFHGITEFVVPTARGDRPVSSGLRRVPALWNMVSSVDRRVAVLGWWATWPAETVNGVVVSDRALYELEERVYPPDYLERYLSYLQEVRDPSSDLARGAIFESDRVMIRALLAAVQEDYDLVLAYLRGVDLASHFNWRYFEPQGFPEVPRAVLEKRRELIAREYEIVDEALAQLLERTGGQANILVMSDHGFHAMDEEELLIRLDLDIVLEALGYQSRTGEGVDISQSIFYTHNTPKRESAKLVRFCLQGREPEGSVAGEDGEALFLRLKEDLERVQYSGGAQALAVRGPRRGERRRGADFVVEVLSEGASHPLLLDGTPLPRAMDPLSRRSGTHGRDTPGIFVLTGPDIRPLGRLDDLRVLDVPPTVLYGLGLPGARDFAGQARTDLFTSRFRQGHALKLIGTWGERSEEQALEQGSAVDERLLEELRALGYID